MKKTKLIVPNTETKNNYMYVCKLTNIFSAHLEGLEENLSLLKDDGKFELAQIEFMIICKIRKTIEQLCNSQNTYKKTYDFSQLGFFQNEIDIASENEAENNLAMSMNSYTSKW